MNAQHALWRRLVAACSIGIVVVSTLPAVAAPVAPPPKQPAAKADNTLDDELLKGLGGDPLDGLDKPAPATKPAPVTKPAPRQPAGESRPSGPAKKPAPNALDEDLLKGLEEPGKGSADDPAGEGNPLERLNRQMRQVEELIRSKKSDEATQQLQKKIVGELDELIQEMQKRQQQQQQSQADSSKKPQQTEAREKVAQPQTQPGGEQRKPNQKPAKDSSDTVGKAEVKRPEMSKMQDLLKDIWGELPPRLRQQMMQSSGERFVPKYELQTEEYFKRLADRPGEK